jgi:hypothetical protein
LLFGAIKRERGIRGGRYEISSKSRQLVAVHRLFVLRTGRGWTARPAANTPSGAHGQGAAWPEMDGRAAHRQLQCSHRQARHKVAAERLREQSLELTSLVVRFQHSHAIGTSTFANVGIKGPLENIVSSGALDLTFAYEGAASRLANVKSAPLVSRAPIIPRRAGLCEWRRARRRSICGTRG